jgi:hypothetical protein
VADPRREVTVHAAGIIEQELEVSEYLSRIGRPAFAVVVHAPAIAVHGLEVAVPEGKAAGEAPAHVGGSRPEQGEAGGRSQLPEDVDDSRLHERGMAEAAGVRVALRAVRTSDNQPQTGDLIVNQNASIAAGVLAVAR